MSPKKLTDSQLVLLSAASQRKDGAIDLAPNLKGSAAKKTVGKLLRDARVMTLYEGTSQIQKLVIGRALTGVSAF